MAARDNAKNFAKVTLSTGYDAAATSVVLTTGGGAKLPTVSFNAIWYNSTDYTDPTDDPNVEIVRVTAISTDTLTITRGQEGTSAVTHNTASKTYKLIAGLTAKTMNSDLIGNLGNGGANYIAVWNDANSMAGYAGFVFTAGTGLSVFNAGAAATKGIDWSGSSATTWWLNRNGVAAGVNLTIQAGGAVSAGTNFAGGDLILSGGIATGTGLSHVYVYAAPGGASGATDSNPAQVAAFYGTGIFLLGVAGTLQGTLQIAGKTSGTVSITTAAAAGTWTLTLPTGAGTAGQFLKTDGAGVTSWVTGATALTYKTGTATRAGNTASGSQTIAHGLGTTPKFVFINATWGGSSFTPAAESFGSYDTVTTACVFLIGSGDASNSSNMVDLQQTSSILQQATIAVDATNITLTWTKTGAASAATMNLQWAAWG